MAHTAISSPIRPARCLLGIAVMLLGLVLTPATAHAQQICYAMADAGGAGGGDDWLTRVDRSTGAETPVGIGTGTNLIEAIAYSPFSSKLYGANAGQFGEINTTTGVFSNIGSGFGTATGAIGGSPVSVNLSDVDGLHFDPYPGELHGVHRRGGTNENDLLFVIDRVTGTYIAGAFPDNDGDGNPDDFLEIKSGAVGVWDIDDLAIDPSDGGMYATGNNGGAANRLILIDRITGIVTDVGSVGYDDIEGISFDTSGQLFGSSGNNGGVLSNYLFNINKSTGAGTPIALLTVGSDYEGLACLTDGINQISGTVYLDADEDATFDTGESGTSGVVVRLFRDDNGNGYVDTGEPQVGTQTTDSNGEYTFDVAGAGDFVVRVYESDLPQGATLTTDDVEAASFPPGTYGAHDQNNDFGHTAPPLTGDLSVTKTSNASGPVPVGFTLEYTITVENTGSITQTNVAVRDTLADNITYVANSTSVTAPGTLNGTFSDDFSEQNYNGDDGTESWAAAWSEVGENGKPDKNDVQVAQDGSQTPYGVFIKKANKGIEREADLSAYSSATLSFRYRGDGTGSGDIMTIYAKTGSGSFTQVAQVNGAPSAYQTLSNISLDSYISTATSIRFVVTTLGGGGRQFWVDDVVITASGSGTTTTPGNAPPLLTSGHTLAPGETMTITLQATVNNNPNGCAIPNTAWAESDQTTEPAGGSRLDLINSSSNCALPVELTRFDVQLDGQAALLAWETASELNNAGFFVELDRGKTGHFEQLDFVDGHGTTDVAQTYAFRVDRLEPGRHVFRLKQVDYDGAFEYSPEVEVIVEMPERFIVEPAYPNPFNPEATVRFAINRSQRVEVSLYDMLGRRVKVLYHGEPSTGALHAVRIDGSDLASGLYLVRVVGASFLHTQKVALVK